MLETERVIKVDLPKEDMENLMELCGMHGNSSKRRIYQR